MGLDIYKYKVVKWEDAPEGINPQMDWMELSDKGYGTYELNKEAENIYIRHLAEKFWDVGADVNEEYYDTKAIEENISKETGKSLDDYELCMSTGDELTAEMFYDIKNKLINNKIIFYHHDKFMEFLENKIDQEIQENVSLDKEVFIEKYKDYFEDIEIYFAVWEFCKKDSDNEKDSFQIYALDDIVEKEIVVERRILVKETGYQRKGMKEEFYTEILSGCWYINNNSETLPEYSMEVVISNDQLDKVKKYIDYEWYGKDTPILKWKLEEDEFIRFSY